MNRHEQRYINAERRRDPMAYAADDHERATADAEHAVWLCVHDDDGSGFDDLMTMLHDVATSDDIAIMHQVLRRALAHVKERDETAAAALWDRLVEIIKETKE